MAELSEEIRFALEADDRERLDAIVERGAAADAAALKALVGDPDTPPAYRRRAMYALSEWSGDKSDVVQLIEQGLPGFDELERISAVAALGQIGGAEAIRVISARRVDAAPDVRRQVARALGTIGTPEAIEQLQAIEKDDQVDLVRDMAVRQLRRLQRK